MANHNHARTHGANARAQGWDDFEEDASQRTGSWLPLDALDEERYVAGPQLRAMPTSDPRREVFRPTPKAPEQPQLTRQYPAQTAQAAQTAQPKLNLPRRKEATRQRTGTEGVQARAVAMVLAAALAALALYVTVSAAVEWTQVKLNDFQYGRPRTAQIDAYVGHNEVDGVPSHFIAMNLNRRVTVLELPGSDSAKATAIVGPYLFGQGEDLTPVQLAAQDVNGDGKTDLVVSVKNEQLIYLNDGATFKLVTPEERAAIQKALAAQQSNGATGQAPGGEAGK